MGPHQEDRLLRTRRRPCGEGLMRDTDKVHATATDAQWGRRERYCYNPPKFVRENVLFLVFSTLVSFVANLSESTSSSFSSRPHHLSRGSEAMF